jgi:ribonuclease Z
MFDCGEGTQIQMINYKIRRSRVNHIFISHLHGDHYFGLIGLINSFALLGRVQPLHVYGHAALKELIDFQFRLSDTQLPFQLVFHSFEKAGIVLEAKTYTVEIFPTRHRISCYGFIVREKKNLRRINIEETKKREIPFTAFAKLQAGEDYVELNGTIIRNNVLTVENDKPKTYVFCADTIFDEQLAPVIKDADILYHETTYPHTHLQKAAERFHSTTKQAAVIAKLSNAKKLLIGHFSAKYDELGIFEQETREVFPNTELALEGVTYLI